MKATEALKRFPNPRTADERVIVAHLQLCVEDDDQVPGCVRDYLSRDNIGAAAEWVRDYDPRLQDTRERDEDEDDFPQHSDHTPDLMERES